MVNEYKHLLHLTDMNKEAKSSDCSNESDNYIQLARICCLGLFDELTKYDTRKLRRYGRELVASMDHTLCDIQVWECEDSNQYSEILDNFSLRSEGIKKCQNYLMQLNVEKSS